MSERQSVCIRRLSGGDRSGIVGFGRFLSNTRVTVGSLIEGWGSAASLACAGRHVLAIQDTSNINFHTEEGRRRGLGKIGHGGGYGVLLHAMLGLDAETGGLLGLVSGRVWTRDGVVSIPHAKRLLADKESERWISTSQAAKSVLADAALVTEISDREGDLYVKWVQTPGPRFHILTRAMIDRRIKVGGKLSTACLRAGGAADVELRERHDRPARTAHLEVRFGQVELMRPRTISENGLAPTVKVSLVEVVETGAPKGAQPVLWRLLTTHDVQDAASAWQMVEWYRMRWTIEQYFRTLKLQGLRLEDSQLESADKLIKLTAIAARSACTIMQLVQARDGRSGQAAHIAFTDAEMETLEAMLPQLEGKTALQKNPHARRSLAWAAWIIAKLGGWDGYPKSKPPGPITFRHGLQHFKSIAKGWEMRDV